MPKVDFLALAEYVRARDGQIDGFGLLADTVHVQAVPAAHTMGIASRVLFDVDEMSARHRGRIRITTADNDTLSQIDFDVEPEVPPNLPEGWPVGFLIAVNAQFFLPLLGFYVVTLAIDGEDLDRRAFRVLPIPGAEGG